MKRLSAFLLSFALTFGSMSYASTATIVKGDVQEGFQDLLTNSALNYPTVGLGWTTGTGVTVSADTTNYVEGKQSAALSGTGVSGTLFYQDVTVGGRFNGVNLGAESMVRTSTTGLQVCPRVGATTLTSQCIAVPATGTWQPLSPNMIGPSSGSVGVALYSANPVTLTGTSFARAYTGIARNLSQVSQAQLIGQVKITGCASDWTTTSTSAANFAAQTGCTYAVTAGTQCTAPGTNIPALTCPSLGPGNYALKYEGPIEQTTQGKKAFFRFTDGTNNALEQSAMVSVTGGDTVWNGLSQSIQYTTAQSNVTIQIQGWTDSGGTAALYGTSTLPSVISVYYFPSQSQLALRPDATPASWSGYQTIASGWTTASTTYADPGAGTTISLTQTTNRNFGTVSSAASSLPGIIAPLPRTGNFRVCAYTAIAISGTANASARLVDGAGTVIDPGKAITSATATGVVPLCGIYTASVAGSTTFKVQLATSVTANVAYIQNTGFGATGSAGIQWTIEELDAPMPAPYLVGSVSCQSAGACRTSSYTIGSTAGGCAVTSVDDPGAAGSSPATGKCLITFGKAFSAAPNCTPSIRYLGTNSTFSAMVDAVTGAPTAAHVNIAGVSTGYAAADGFTMTCTGPN